MHQLAPYALWLGHVGDARNLNQVLTAGIRAMVDLAENELPTTITRELVYFRFPLVDGAGNLPWLLRARSRPWQAWSAPAFPPWSIAAQG